MHIARKLVFSFLATTAVSVVGGASAEDWLTREQVRTELQAAQREGSIPHGDLDITTRTGPDIHPALASKGCATRADVKAALREAISDGDVSIGERGRTLAEIQPTRYAKPAAEVGLSRAAVKAELARAIRDGGIPLGETGRTPAEISPQRYAEARARDGLSGKYAAN